MVVIRLPEAALMGVRQLRAAVPSMCTVHAPQSPMPQPNFVPVSSRPSRKYHRSGISGSPSYCAVFPLIVNWIIDAPSLMVQRRNQERVSGAALVRYRTTELPGRRFCPTLSIAVLFIKEG